MALQNLKISVQSDEKYSKKEKSRVNKTLEIVLADDENNSNYDSDDVVLNVDYVKSENFSNRQPKIYENKGLGKFAVGFDPTTKENISKRIQRSQRFGTQWTELAQEEYNIEQLYERLGIKKEDIESVDGGEKGWRLDTVHVHGVDDMSTDDLFKYFDRFAPSSIEWINDTSCNVVWNDREGAARAILGCMQRFAEAGELSTDTLEKVDDIKMEQDDNKEKKKTQRKVKKRSEPNLKSSNNKQLNKDNNKNNKKEQEIREENSKTSVTSNLTARKNVKPKLSNDIEEKMEEDDLTFSLVSDEEDEGTSKITSKTSLNQKSTSDDITMVEKEELNSDNESSSSSSSSSGSSSGSASSADSSSSSSSSSGEDSSSDSESENDMPTKKKESQALNIEVTDFGENKQDDNQKSSLSGKWVVGVSYGKADRPLYLRFATKNDRKIPGAEKRSQYYVKYGNPNFGGVQGIISGSRRRRTRIEAIKAEMTEAKRAVKKRTRERTESESFDDLLKEAQKRQKTNSESDSYASNEDEGLYSGSEGDGDVRIELATGGVPVMMQMKMRADIEEEEKMQRREQIDSMRASRHSVDVRSRLTPRTSFQGDARSLIKANLPSVTDVRSRIEQRKHQRYPEMVQNKDYEQTSDLRHRLGRKNW